MLDKLTESRLAVYVCYNIKYSVPSVDKCNVNAFGIIFIVLLLAMWLHDPDVWRSQWIVLTSAG